MVGADSFGAPVPVWIGFGSIFFEVASTAELFIVDVVLIDEEDDDCNVAFFVTVMVAVVDDI
jgi:hypothetical protein